MRCPRCRGHLLDLRGCGFNARALEAEGICFAWDKGMFTCVRKKVVKPVSRTPR